MQLEDRLQNEVVAAKTAMGVRAADEAATTENRNVLIYCTHVGQKTYQALERGDQLARNAKVRNKTWEEMHVALRMMPHVLPSFGTMSELA